jgi:hypothetical protein
MKPDPENQNNNNEFVKIVLERQESRMMMMSGQSSTSSLTKTLLESLPPIPNLSPALLPTMMNILEEMPPKKISQSLPNPTFQLLKPSVSSQQISEDEENNFFIGSAQNNEELICRSFTLEPKLDSGKDDVFSISSKEISGNRTTHSSILNKSDISIDVASSLGAFPTFYSNRNSSSSSRAHSGGSSSRRNARRNLKSDSSSLGSANSEDDEIDDQSLKNAFEAGGFSSSFLSSASLPLTPFKNQVLFLL